MNLREKDVVNLTINSSSGKDVKDTQMLKGEAHNSLFGKNATKQDVRSGGKSEFGKLGGMPTVK
jgi:hypothetical protein